MGFAESAFILTGFEGEVAMMKLLLAVPVIDCGFQIVPESSNQLLLTDIC